ncbi:Uncharacterised protein [Sphingobacterium thalpophilum]|uniref:Uncharacterized protein n=1 Tax=Sphingobacterium thalpophilum TaxID=259 RepID=A0A4V6KN11_9SPHI|nr:Uncharacterised protein [Sphingobacterium thalpophilum]
MYTLYFVIIYSQRTLHLCSRQVVYTLHFVITNRPTEQSRRWTFVVYTLYFVIIYSIKEFRKAIDSLCIPFILGPSTGSHLLKN